MTRDGKGAVVNNLTTVLTTATLCSLSATIHLAATVVALRRTRQEWQSYVKNGIKIQKGKGKKYVIFKGIRVT